MPSIAIKFSALIFTALALVPAGAHVMELPNKLHLPAERYLIVQGIYRGWALAGVFVVGALIATLALSLRLRHRRGFVAAFAATGCILATQFVFWSVTYPVNSATQNWTTLPENWEVLRLRWEYSHAASALLNLIALLATATAVLRSSRSESKPPHRAPSKPGPALRRPERGALERH
jgi:hypothetical protein